MKNIAATDAAPSARKPPSIRFFRPLKSAMVPRSGESTAMMTMPMVVAMANHRVASSSFITPPQATLE